MTDSTDFVPPILGAVVASGSAVHSETEGLGEMIEKAMVEAIHDCYAQGLTDSDSILKAKMEAMEKVRSGYANYIRANS
jgi:hypothetical protein